MLSIRSFVPSVPTRKHHDKMPTRFDGPARAGLGAGGYRVVPPAVARRGAFIARIVVLMPSYVTIGAYVAERTMVVVFTCRAQSS